LALCAACRERRHPAELEPYSVIGLIRASAQVAAALGLGAFAMFALLRTANTISDRLFADHDRFARAFKHLLDFAITCLIQAPLQAVITLTAIAMIGRLGPPAYRAAFVTVRSHGWLLLRTALASYLLIGIAGGAVYFAAISLLVRTPAAQEHTVGYLTGTGYIRDAVACYMGALLTLAVPIALLEGTGAWRSFGLSTQRLLRRSGTIFFVAMLFLVPAQLLNAAVGRFGDEWQPEAELSALQALDWLHGVCWVLLTAATTTLRTALTAVLYLRHSNPAAS
jgi:hypothetical protein